MYYFNTDRNDGNTLPIHVDQATYEHREGTPVFSHHNHEVLEILGVLEGALSVTVGGETRVLHAGELAVVNPYEIHAGTPVSPQLTYLWVTASLKKLLPYPNTRLTQAVTALLDGSGRFERFLSGETAGVLLDSFVSLGLMLRDKSPAGECASAELAFRCFSLLFEKYYVETGTSSAGRRDLEFLRSVSRYLSEHYARDISTQTVCQALYMEASPFCHKFRKHFGASFSNYLCQYRVLQAANRYAGSELPVTRIAREVGFTDYCYFSRSFKKYIGRTPAHYFRKWKESEEM